MKGVYLRKNSWWLRYSVAGKQHFESLGTQDEAEAIVRARVIMENPELQKAQPWLAELRIYLEERVKKGRMSKNSADGRLSVLKRFSEEYEIERPQQVTTALAVQWYGELQDRIAETTAQTYMSWLKSFMEFLADKRRIRRNPVSVEMDLLRRPKRKPFCTREQVKTMIAAAPTDELRFALYCGFHAGLRRGEIAEARPEWFDLQAGLLHIQKSDSWQPKDRDDRTVPLTKEFARFIESYGLRSPFMLPGKTMKRERKWRYRYDFRRPFEQLAASLNLEWVTPHTMRRTFASLLVSDGVSLYKVAVWLGDLERVVQDHYGYMIPKDADIERGHSPSRAAA